MSHSLKAGFDQLQLEFITPGFIHHTPDGLTHTKTLPCIIIAQTVSGQYEVTCGKDHALIDPGELFLVPPNTEVTIIHHADQNGMMQARWVHLNFTLSGGFDISSFLELPLKAIPPVSTQIGKIIQELLDLEESESTLKNQSRKHLLAYQILGLLCQTSSPLTKPKRSTAPLKRLTPVFSYIQNHLAEPITVDNLAKKASLSSSRFHACFKETMQVSPMEYVIRYRLEEACKQLLTTDKYIGEIAEAVGYPNQFHFSRTFSEKYGISPSEYRRQHQDMVV